MSATLHSGKGQAQDFVAAYAKHNHIYDSIHQTLDADNNRSFGSFGFHYKPETHVLQARVCILSSQVKANPETADLERKADRAHPGTILQHYNWNNSDETVLAKNSPDSIKFIYYDAAGHETSDIPNAKTRVPVVEIVIMSVDAEGNPITPHRAKHFEMTAYGPGHCFLRHTTANVSAH